MKLRAFVLASAVVAMVLFAADRPARIYVVDGDVPSGTEAAAFQQVPPPAVKMQANEAQATTAPWIDSNAWRFQRGLTKAIDAYEVVRSHLMKMV